MGCFENQDTGLTLVNWTIYKTLLRNILELSFPISIGNKEHGRKISSILDKILVNCWDFWVGFDLPSHVYIRNQADLQSQNSHCILNCIFQVASLCKSNWEPHKFAKMGKDKNPKRICQMLFSGSFTNIFLFYYFECCIFNMQFCC